MRLSNRIISVIKTSAKQSFGDVPIYLFGSRVDDTKKGGDIDIAVDTGLARDLFKKQKMKFISTMVGLGFDLKIDIVRYRTDDELLFDEIRNNCVML